MSDTRTFTARWLFPVSSPPLERGTITIRGDIIEAVEPHGTRTPDEDLGNVALIPGLVNAHTHLDLSGARGLTPPTTPDTFTDWLRSVIAYRRTRTAEQIQTDITNGLAECLKHGTTLIGDIASEGASWDALATASTRAVVFHEMLGLSEKRAMNAVEVGKRWIETHGRPRCRTGLSPHAPYSVHRAVIEAAARVAPVCIHLAESAEEKELLDRHAGPFVPFLKRLGVWNPAALAPSWDWVAWRCSRAPHALLAHGNYLPSNTAIGPQSTLVYCPRTHAAFGHPPYPLAAFLAAGHRVALGTDSLASNPDLDVLAEARAVRAAHPDIPAATVLRMATLAGADAVGMGHVTGSLTPGKSADVVAMAVADAEPADPHDLLLTRDLPAIPRRTMWRGQWRA